MKNVCITGTDRGLGLELVKRYLEKGWRVFAGRYGEASGELAELARAYPDRLLDFPLDVGSDDSVRAAAAFVRERADSLDLLVNNAGILGDIEKTVGDDGLDFDEMLNVINVNALGALRMVHALRAEIMRSEDKLVANISSEAGSIAACWRTGWYGYGMSKAALNMQSAIVHNALRQEGGRLLLIHPGWMQTHMRGRLDAGATYTAEEASGLIAQVIEDRKGDNGERPAFVDLLGEPYPW